MDDLFYKARRIVALEAEYEQNIKHKFPDTSFAAWILSSKSINTLEEFHTLHAMGKVLTICDHFGIAKDKQPCNYAQHFQLLQRYIHNANLLASIWQNALHLANNDPNEVTLSHLSSISQQLSSQHTNYNDSHNGELQEDNDKKQIRKKITDDVIIAFWKENPSKTLLSVQKKYNAGYNRVKRLREIALNHTNTNKRKRKLNESEDIHEESSSPSKKRQCIRDRNKEAQSEFAKEAYLAMEKEKDTKKRRAQWIQKTFKALEYLKKDVSAYFFLKPVDKELCAAYDYDLVISEPMDFETLEKNLHDNKYLNLSDFIIDIELIFINAKIYNPPMHSVHRAAETLQKLFKSNFQSIIGEHADQDTLKRWNYLDRPGGFQYGLQHQNRKIAKRKKELKDK